MALDTSAAVPFLVRTHPSHDLVTSTLQGRLLVLTSHSLAETYSVITRLPDDARVAPTDAAQLINSNFGPALLVSEATATGLPTLLADLGIAGGAVYDALVALAAREHGTTLVTRDARARGTYARVGVDVLVLE